jgi:CDP-paratose 2-epimerase
MSVVIVTGSSGLVGTEVSHLFAENGLDVIGLDNNMRRYFFGVDGDTAWRRKANEQRIRNYKHVDVDIRDHDGIKAIFRRHGRDIAAVIHTAAQPSHDWAAREPLTDFTVNANGTLNMLELTRQFCPDAVFVFTSTNKVYGDTPNRLPLIEKETRLEIPPDHPYAEGIDEGMSVDQTLHSLFGASKLAADALVQEYGRYFGMRTACFRAGCITGPGHSAAQLHGFLTYLVKCALTGTPYTVFGYQGKQVRDNILARDLASAFWYVFRKPRIAEVYNIGGGRQCNCSMIEAINIVERITTRPLKPTYKEDNRIGDHRWWISDIRKFQSHYLEWRLTSHIDALIEEIAEGLSCRAV